MTLWYSSGSGNNGNNSNDWWVPIVHHRHWTGFHVLVCSRKMAGKCRGEKKTHNHFECPFWMERAKEEEQGAGYKLTVLASNVRLFLYYNVVTTTRSYDKRGTELICGIPWYVLYSTLFWLPFGWNRLQICIVLNVQHHRTVTLFRTKK